MKAYKGMGMEGGIARWYDRTTRKDMPEFRALAARIAGLVPPAGSVLEVAPGPGFLSIEMARRGLNVRAVDISQTFVEIATRNAAAEGVRARFERGNASALPVNDASVDFVVCRAAFKNFSEPVKALAEMRRVLRPGGTALLIDLRRDVRMSEIKRYIDGLGVGWLSRLLMRFTFRNMLIKRAYMLDEIRRMATEAGWPEPRIESSGVGFEAWMKR
ncbi:MAG TPA: methyltransferase domain-containing protein [Terracidiphilus sp.]|jgi:ubiquinone/menaquinone biosynthesis C-methylase UbiE|nr:methyltransferase domain-containing protein [Terracidiphilus sp.]